VYYTKRHVFIIDRSKHFFIDPPSMNHCSGCAHNIIIFASDLYVSIRVYLYILFISLFISPNHQLITILYRYCDRVGCQRFFSLTLNPQTPHHISGSRNFFRSVLRKYITSNHIETFYFLCKYIIL
jgi:hypothetical protein